MRARGRWLGIVIAVVMSSSAYAYTGGPRIVEVLGWDPRLERVYCRMVLMDESGAFGSVYHFDLRSHQPARRIRETWSDPVAEENDTTQVRQLAALRRRLKRIDPKPVEALPTWIAPIDTTMVEFMGDRIPRIRTRATFATGEGFEIVSYGSGFCAKAVYAFPGRSGALWVLAFRGVPGDPAETEKAFWVTQDAQDHAVKVEWNWETDR